MKDFITKAITFVAAVLALMGIVLAILWAFIETDANQYYADKQKAKAQWIAENGNIPRNLTAEETQQLYHYAELKQLELDRKRQ